MSHARHQSSSPRKSMRASEPLSSLDQTMLNGAHSLAHELAVALMPEPGGGSRMLAEEFGIEYDEGAEGIDEDECARGNKEREVHAQGDSLANEIGSSLADEMGGSSLADELGGGGSGSADEDADEDVEDSLDGDDGDDSFIPRRREQDAMEILAQNLASTDQFLTHLRAVDALPTLSSSHTSDAAPSAHVLERLASDMIRAINEATKERESQVRELIAYEREFRRLSTEVGGNDVLCELDDIDEGEIESEPAPTKLDTVAEEDELDSSYAPSLPSSPEKPSFAVPQPSSAAAPLPHLVQLRTHTAALLSSLTTISEQAQVNGAATADSGRRIRALKNRFGGLRGEWEGAERSRGRVERWEQEGADHHCSRVAEEHMIAFQQAIDEAGLKTQAIMAR